MQGSASKPNRIAILWYLSCHLKSSYSIGETIAFLQIQHKSIKKNTYVFNFSDLYGINFLKSAEIRVVGPC